MQLRVARLCLDCEELHAENSCPVCASERFAFLSTWLQVEERRKWPRGKRTPVAPEDGVTHVARKVSKWLRGDQTPDAPAGPATRRSDHVTHLNFDGPADEPAAPTVRDSQLSKRHS